MRKALSELARAIADEAERNPEFARRVEEAICIKEKPKKSGSSRAAHRRAPAVIDPIELAREGEAILRAHLAELDVEQLKDVVADYGMDPAKLVLRWKSTDRIIERIVEVAIGRARKGEGFLSSSSPGSE